MSAIHDHVAASIGRPLPELEQGEPREGVFVLVGGGPSVENHRNDIRALKGGANKIASVNEAHGWLIEDGPVPDYCVLAEINLDPIAMNLQPNSCVIYLIASLCHPSIFQRFGGCRVIRWHPDIGWCRRYVGSHRPDAVFVGGGATGAMRALGIGYVMGYRRFAVFGLDSSFGATSHAYRDDRTREITVERFGKSYQTRSGLVRQADEFLSFCKEHSKDCEFDVRGAGMLPEMFNARMAQIRS